MKVSIVSAGNFNKTEKFLTELKKSKLEKVLDFYGEEGVRALAMATPVDTGETAKSWSYNIVETKTGLSLVWTNSNVKDGVPIAILLQYGHATGTGGYVQGMDYINPALQPIFDKLSEAVMTGVVRL